MKTCPMKIKQVILHLVKKRLKHPFVTSFGTLKEKEFFVIEMIDENGAHGFGESVAFSAPWYTEETVKTNKHIMADFLIPLIFQKPVTHPDEISARFSVIRRNHMAKAALEGAIWDLYAKRQHIPLAKSLGGTKKKIDVGISIGIQPKISALLEVIHRSLGEGYKRIKIKIKPGFDVEVLREVRKHFPDIPLMVDANSAYQLEDLEHLKRLDEFNLLMIEQPLAHNDFLDHAKLQSQLETPICLDESIHTFEDTRLAIKLGSCKILNIKIGRVGGLTEAKRIHDYCKSQKIPVWCGGMLEGGIGRAHNIALATLDQFIFPGDISGSNRYWNQDLIEPEVTVNAGVIKVPEKPGIGYEIKRDLLKTFEEERMVFSNPS